MFQIGIGQGSSIKNCAETFKFGMHNCKCHIHSEQGLELKCECIRDVFHSVLMTVIIIY